MKIYIDILLASLILVFIIDLSGFVEDLREAMGRYFGVKVRVIKPFFCSLCMTFWVGIIIALTEHSFSFSTLAYICLCAYLTPVFKGILMLVLDCLVTLINKMNIKL